jgi:hypothetical protein
MKTDFDKVLETFEGKKIYEIRSGVKTTSFILTETNIEYTFNKDGSLNDIIRL